VGPDSSKAPISRFFIFLGRAGCVGSAVAEMISAPALHQAKPIGASVASKRGAASPSAGIAHER